MTEEYLENSGSQIGRAKQLLSGYDYVGAIEAAQHSIEISIKALYLLVGQEPPKEHHAGQEFLTKVVDRLVFPSYFGYLKDDLCRAMWISKMYEWAHTASVYGFKGISPSKLIHEKDAKTALEYADEVYSTCRLVVDAANRKEITLRA